MHLSKQFLRVFSIELVIIVSVGSHWKPSEYVYQMAVEGMTSNTVASDLCEVSRGGKVYEGITHCLSCLKNQVSMEYLRCCECHFGYVTEFMWKIKITVYVG